MDFHWSGTRDSLIAAVQERFNLLTVWPVYESSQAAVLSFLGEELRVKAITCVIRGFEINRRRNKEAAWLNEQKKKKSCTERNKAQIKCHGKLW